MGNRLWPLLGTALLVMSTACSAPNPAPPNSIVPAALPTSAALQPSQTSADSTTVPLPIRDDALRDRVIVDGSSTVFPITEAVAHEFSAVAPNVQVQLGVSGTTGGFKKFCAGETAISDASRPIEQTESATCMAHKIAFLELPIAYDGISIVVNKQNAWLRCITVAELKRLWEPAAETALVRWNQLRPDLPNERVHLHGAGKDSGTFDYFTSAIVGTAGASRTDYTGSEDDYLTAQDVAADPYAMGYFGYAYYREYQDQLNVVAIDNGSGCIAPNEESIVTGSYQPLSRPLFIYVRSDALARPAVRAFVDFYLANAARIVAATKYVPLPTKVYDLVRERRRTQRSGSVFKGGAQVGISIENLLKLEQH